MASQCPSLSCPEKVKGKGKESKGKGKSKRQIEREGQFQMISQSFIIQCWNKVRNPPSTRMGVFRLAHSRVVTASRGIPSSSASAASTSAGPPYLTAPSATQGCPFRTHAFHAFQSHSKFSQWEQRGGTDIQCMQTSA